MFNSLKNYRYQIIFLVFFIFVGVLLFQNPIAQDLAYHDFGDQRKIFEIPNFWNVMSNLPLFFIGIYGTWVSLQHWKLRPDLVSKLLPLVLCLGIFIACFGSAYYHWAPDNYTLVWDRLPMTLMFMPIFSLLIYDFIGKKEGRIAFYILVPLGIFSVFYWRYTEMIGQGDLRFYIFVQFFPMIIAPFVLCLFPKKTNYVRYIYYILGWYILAKLTELFDDVIFDFLGFWSGHTIKHLLGAISLYYVLKLIIGWEKELLRDHK
ncbi:MAG: alkaline phytoceramidase [Saprospiraceae bacterium]